eukprot:scaffold2930_cov244-Pinguiococcus_pyrenoidosus.AAC.14
MDAKRDVAGRPDRADVSRCARHGSVAGTRKTTPGFRIVEKYALLVGGGATHRLDLSQMVMLKDNHIWSAGSITDAVKVARSAAGFSAKVSKPRAGVIRRKGSVTASSSCLLFLFRQIEVEARTLEEGVEAAEAGADIVMLDNFEPGALKVAAKELKRLHPSVLIEASGGITTATMGDYFSEHVDIISQGNLTQGYPVVDFSLKIQK